jgi:hypothetical protein
MLKFLLLASIFFIKSNASGQSEGEVVKHKMILPIEDAESYIIKKNAATISAVIYKSDKIYCYTASDSTKGKF